MSNITVKQALELQTEMESKIVNAVQQFETATRLVVNDISLRRTGLHSDTRRHATYIEVHCDVHLSEDN